MSIIQHVLVIEDDTGGRDLLTRLFRFYGIKATIVSDANNAIVELQNFIPSLIITDLALPGMDGWKLLHALKQKESLNNTPVVAITAFHTAELAQEAINAGFDAYFAKPLNVNTFITELEGLVAKAN